MSRLPTTLLFTGLLAAGLALPGAAWAQDDLKPEVMLMIDGSRLMGKTLENLFIHVRAIRKMTISQKDRAARSIADHMRIIEALEKRDTELAERLVRQHSLDLARHVEQARHHVRALLFQGPPCHHVLQPACPLRPCRHALDGLFQVRPGRHVPASFRVLRCRRVQPPLLNKAEDR